MIDDSFVFDPPECNGNGWSTSPIAGSNRTLKSCTSSNPQQPPSARLTFTGVAISYISPIIQGQGQDDVMVVFRVDGVPSEVINLSSRPPATNQDTSLDLGASNVVWTSQNLNNSAHTFEIFPANAGQPTLAVDAIILTQLSPESVPTSMVPPLPTSPSTNSLGGAAAGVGGIGSQAALQTGLFSQDAVNRLAYGIGSTLGIIGIVGFCLITSILWRRRKELRSKYPPGFVPPPLTSTRGATTHYLTETQLSDEYYNAPAKPRLDTRIHYPETLWKADPGTQTLKYPSPTQDYDTKDSDVKKPQHTQLSTDPLPSRPTIVLPHPRVDQNQDLEKGISAGAAAPAYTLLPVYPLRLPTTTSSSPIRSPSDTHPLQHKPSASSSPVQNDLSPPTGLHTSLHPPPRPRPKTQSTMDSQRTRTAVSSISGALSLGGTTLAPSSPTTGSVTPSGLGYRFNSGRGRLHPDLPLPVAHFLGMLDCSPCVGRRTRRFMSGVIGFL